jgi:hypothetical protein
VTKAQLLAISPCANVATYCRLTYEKDVALFSDIVRHELVRVFRMDTTPRVMSRRLPYCGGVCKWIPIRKFAVYLILTN